MTTPEKWPRSAPALALLSGGALVAAGALMPWLTMFAGLQRFPGIIGLNGRLLLVCGMIAMVVGALALWRSSRGMPALAGLLGTTIVALAAWSLAGMYEMLHGRIDAMMIARPGPGLFVILAGGALMLGAPLTARAYSAAVSFPRRIASALTSAQSSSSSTV